MTKTLYDPEVERRGEIKGEVKGEIKGEKKMLLKLLNKKFPNLSAQYIKRINEVSEEVVERISEDIFDIENVKELDKYFE